jgi:diadenosine tetraphosphate (Ap4A) HIT family hydrolase
MSVGCELCTLAVPAVWEDDRLAVILVDEPNYPGFCRVIWKKHVKEMTDLQPADRHHFMDVVWQVEDAVRNIFEPQKVNVASLGNVVPHLHWHVIPRFVDDAHFPAPVWAAPARATDASTLEARRALLPRLQTALKVRLAT